MKNIKKSIIFGLFIFMQILLFRTYLFPYHEIIIQGQSCTCPNAKILSGESYLESITPDSLKQYKLNYSEVFFENGISVPGDWMGVGDYLIHGKVIGENSISEGEGPYYPLFKIHDFKEVFFFRFISWFLRALILIELIIFYLTFKKSNFNAQKQ